MSKLLTTSDMEADMNALEEASYNPGAFYRLIHTIAKNVRFNAHGEPEGDE